MQRSIDPIELLDGQHREAERLFEELAGTHGPARALAFAQLADVLAMHLLLEERHYYPLLHGRGQPLPIEEQRTIKRLVGELLAMETPGDEFDAALARLEESVERHIVVERSTLFPRTRQLFDEQQLDVLGRQLMATLSELEDGSPRFELAREVDEGPRPI